jgi:hypothetical protein
VRGAGGKTGIVVVEREKKPINKILSGDGKFSLLARAGAAIARTKKLTGEIFYVATKIQ